MSRPSGVSYRLHSVNKLHWAARNDEYVVFDEASGQTHQLDAVRAFVLQLLSESTQTFADVEEALAALPAFSEKPSTNEILRTVFSEFEARGLVEAIEQ